MSTHSTNPQAEQMADESMVRTLSAQAEAIWPQESMLFRRYELPPEPRILDVGCGTGEITRRVAELLPTARVLGIDLYAPHLELARTAAAELGERVEFRVGNAFELDLPADEFDLSLCRHMLQAIPDPERVVAELARVTRSGGRLHLLAEDYAMIHFHTRNGDADEFWRRGPIAFAEQTGSDLRSGRRMFAALRQAGLRDIQVDYVVVDTLRVPREIFAAIWTGWRDGYAEAIARETDLSREEVDAHFESMLATLRDPDLYAAWQIPILTGIVA